MISFEDSRAYVTPRFKAAFKSYVDNIASVVKVQKDNDDVQNAVAEVAEIWAPAHKDMVDIFRDNNDVCFSFKQQEVFQKTVDFLLEQEFNGIDDELKKIVKITQYSQDPEKCDDKAITYFKRQYAALVS